MIVEGRPGRASQLKERFKQGNGGLGGRESEEMFSGLRRKYKKVNIGQGKT